MNRAALEKIVDAAIEEDVGLGDITTEAVVPVDTWAAAEIVARQEGVIAGLPVAALVFARVDSRVQFIKVRSDGQRVQCGDVVAKMEGPAAAILTAERTALNFLQRLSGIATVSADYVAACAGTSARILDTRKTVPGLRMLDKYAVRMGGASNHRVGLFDGVLIKENHIRAGGGIARAVLAARERAPHTAKIEVECEDLEQVDEALKAKADVILLDNMSIEQITGAVRQINGQALVEASGEMTLARVPEVARTGVDFISVGALTHSVRALDLSLEITSWRIPGELQA